MFWRSRVVGQHIAHVASAADDREEFARRARAAATALGRSVIGKSRDYFLSPPDKPLELCGRYEGFGEWSWLCLEAIFEIWFCLGEVALPALRRVAFGIYDPSQAPATDALCRLAVEGLETARTAEQIARALPKWRYEQVLRVRDWVAVLATRSAELTAAYDALVEEYAAGDAVDGFALIAAAARANPQRVRLKYVDFLRGLAAGEGLEGRTAYDDGHVVTTADGRGIVAKGGPTYPLVEDYHAIRAAVLLHQLEVYDRENVARLERWAAAHPHEGVRDQIRELLEAAAGGP